ncbi:MAG: T9SS type A sorting domain-containing protein [Gilvibacter sp.]
MKKALLILLVFIVSLLQANAQSIAREWNEEVLNGVRNDFARPTVHARNLWHTSIAMYDIWALFDATAETYFLGKTVDGYSVPFEGFSTTETAQEAIEKAISFALYRMITVRFSSSPGQADIYASVNELMASRGYDATFTGTDYQSGDPRALGNYMAQQLISFGLQDGSNEENDYANQFYMPVNDPLDTDSYGNPDMEFPNRWQPLFLESFIDQSGNEFPGGVIDFLSPEWGEVAPFALTEDDLTILPRDGYDFKVYHQPDDPWYIQEGLGFDDPYKWGFAMVSVWQSHLDPTDEVMIDISPTNFGNTTGFPTTFEEYQDFYNYFEGGDPGVGRTVNPSTGEPYQTQFVPRGDYARVLAEFWADGPDSETPPGHWFTILNYVNDHPDIEKRFKGEGPELSDLEWDIKAYFALGGAMHDSAITAWGIKGYYDYVRPMSAIRYMADQGQSSDPDLPNYDPNGIPLIPDYIEIVEPGDPLEGASAENVGKIKLYTWQGHEFIIDPEFDTAGVGWILAENWFPYQRISFVTPPFAGYVSGHSTFSRAAAELLTLFTGDEYFPGGMGVFDIQANNFLVFELGPTVDMQLQWATYRDASDQTSLSRIWGGIHPPVDDIPGRKAGIEIGIDAFTLAEAYFNGDVAVPSSESLLFPNPATDMLTVQHTDSTADWVQIFDIQGRRVLVVPAQFNAVSQTTVDVSGLTPGMYFVVLVQGDDRELLVKRLIKN